MGLHTHYTADNQEDNSNVEIEIPAALCVCRHLGVYLPSISYLGGQSGTTTGDRYRRRLQDAALVRAAPARRDERCNVVSPIGLRIAGSKTVDGRAQSRLHPYAGRLWIQYVLLER